MTEKRTPKQNFLGMARGEKPDALFYLGGYNPFSYGEGNPIQYLSFAPDIISHAEFFGGKDIWGVNWITAKSGGTNPEHGNYILPDISKWRDYIKAPDLSKIDWKAMAEKELEENYAMGVSPEDTVIGLWLHDGYVAQLTNFMGFEDALVALYESPEDVFDLFTYMNEFYCKLFDTIIPYYKPDTLHLFDTFAGASPFYSVDVYQELVLPFHMKEAEIAHKYGLPLEMHCAGKSAAFIDAMEPLGINYWIGADPINDLQEVMKKHPSLVMSGGWKQTSDILKEDCPEEVFKQSIRDVIDLYAPTGRFAWFDNIMAGEDNAEDAAKKNQWLWEVLDTYGRNVIANA